MKAKLRHVICRNLDPDGAPNEAALWTLPVCGSCWPCTSVRLESWPLATAKKELVLAVFLLRLPMIEMYIYAVCYSSVKHIAGCFETDSGP